MLWHSISVAVVSWLVQTQWWFFINTISFCMLFGSFRYLQTPQTRSTKSFTKRLSRCGGKCTFIFMFFGICSPTAQSCNMDPFPWSWTRSDTFTLPEDTPQNRLRNGWAVVEASELLCSCFLAYAHQLLSHLPRSILRNFRLIRIPPHSLKMLHKTVYETVERL